MTCKTNAPKATGLLAITLHCSYYYTFCHQKINISLVGDRIWRLGKLRNSRKTDSHAGCGQGSKERFNRRGEKARCSRSGSKSRRLADTALTARWAIDRPRRSPLKLLHYRSPFHLFLQTEGCSPSAQGPPGNSFLPGRGCPRSASRLINT